MSHSLSIQIPSSSSSERASLATTHIYVWYKSPSQLTWTPHSKSGCTVETDDVIRALRECEWIYYSHNVTFWGEEDKGPKQVKN